MKKLFNNSTKGNDTQNKSSKSKRKFLKTFSFTSLALLMGIAGTMAFAPLGANPNALATTSETEYTTEQGLITPKADDPTLYTTESGLDIKFGLAMPTINASLPSGNLQGFPYFTTTCGSITYTWVIIGRNSDVAMLSGGMLPYLYSHWKAASSVSAANAQYYFSNVDITTPAGALIDTQASSKAYVYDKGIDSSITVNDDELPSKSVLCLLNTISTTTYWCTNYKNTSQCFVSSTNNLNQICTGYYNNDTFGFGEIKSLLQQAPLEQYDCWHQNNTEQYIYETAYMYFFPLGCSDAVGNTDPSSRLYENFRWQTYLTANQYKLSSIQFGRSANGSASCDITNTDGSIGWIYTGGTSSSYQAGLRPACLMKLA